MSAEPRRTAAPAGSAGLARIGDLDLCFETFGDPADPALLLVMGFGVQMTGWPVRLCRMFADAGFFVIRYDHRDIGLSTRLADAVVDHDALDRGDPAGLAYTLGDMADDGIALVRSLGVDRVHVLGASMGGMVAQEMAIRHPDVVASLCSIMSTTGDRSVGQADPALLARLAAPVADGRSAAIERAVEVRRLVAGDRYPWDAEEARRTTESGYDRAHYPEGADRHRMAVRFAPDRTEALGRLSMPALVIHGDRDPLVDVSGGIATARAIPDAELVVLAGVGHEIPAPAEREVVDAFARHALSAP